MCRRGDQSVPGIGPFLIAAPYPYPRAKHPCRNAPRPAWVLASPVTQDAPRLPAAHYPQAERP